MDNYKFYVLMNAFVFELASFSVQFIFGIRPVCFTFRLLIWMQWILASHTIFLSCPHSLTGIWFLLWSVTDFPCNFHQFLLFISIIVWSFPQTQAKTNQTNFSIFFSIKSNTHLHIYWCQLMFWCGFLYLNYTLYTKYRQHTVLNI